MISGIFKIFAKQILAKQKPMPKKEVSKLTESKVEPKPQSKPTESKPKEPAKEIQGEGFVMRERQVQESPITQEFQVEQWIQKLSGVENEKWIANLKSLATKHPEMFQNEADVFRVIKEIKDNPTHFFRNYDDEVALIGKQLKSGKAGNIGVTKQKGEIIHINRTKAKDLKRLERRSREGLTGTPLPATSENKSLMREADLLQPSLKSHSSTKDIKAQENYISPMERK